MPPREGLQERPDWHHKCVPIALHGDGVSIVNIRGKASKEINCLSWTSLLSQGQTRLTTFLIWFCFKHLEKKVGIGATWPTFWRALCRSLVALWRGTWPQDHPKAGQPLAGGYYALVYVNRGDLDFMASHFSLSHPSSKLPCSLCSCTCDEKDQAMPWTDCNSNPSWLPTCKTDEARELHKKHPIARSCSQWGQPTPPSRNLYLRQPTKTHDCKSWSPLSLRHSCNSMLAEFIHSSTQSTLL